MSAAADKRPIEEKPRHVHLVLRNVLLPTGVSYHGVRALRSSAEGEVECKAGHESAQEEGPREPQREREGRRTVDMGLAPETDRPTASCTAARGRDGRGERAGGRRVDAGAGGCRRRDGLRRAGQAGVRVGARDGRRHLGSELEHEEGEEAEEGRAPAPSWTLRGCLDGGAARGFGRAAAVPRRAGAARSHEGIMYVRIAIETPRPVPSRAPPFRSTREAASGSRRTRCPAGIRSHGS